MTLLFQPYGVAWVQLLITNGIQMSILSCTLLLPLEVIRIYQFFSISIFMELVLIGTIMEEVGLL